MQNIRVEKELVICVSEGKGRGWRLVTRKKNNVLFLLQISIEVDFVYSLDVKERVNSPMVI